MPKHLELDEILALNPQVDEQLLNQSKELLSKLRQAGISKRNYNLVSPYSRRSELLSKEGSVDPRTVRVGRSARG